MVEFDSVENANNAKASLQGADIYSGCCTLNIQYAKPTKLNVFRNDSETWDYTSPAAGNQVFGAPAKAALLDTPGGGGPPRGGPGGYPPAPGANGAARAGGGFDA